MRHVENLSNFDVRDKHKKIIYFYRLKKLYLVDFIEHYLNGNS